MGKNSGGTRASGNLVLESRGLDPELTESLRDYHLPKEVQGKIESYEAVDTYNKLKEELAKRGITLETGRDAQRMGNAKSPQTQEIARNLLAAIDSYKVIFGKNSLSKLKRVKLHDNDIDATASYFYNEVGENDPKAGSISFSTQLITGREVFHEVAHAVQDSKSGRNETLREYSARAVKEAGLDKSFKGYDASLQHERYAEAVAFGITRGDSRGLAFIKNLYHHK